MATDVLLSRRLTLCRLAASIGIGAVFAPLHQAWAAEAKAAPLGKPIAGKPNQAAKGPRPLIVLDPGHGGKDPGAIGVSGTYEKHVTLAAAIELRRLLEQTGRYRVELTRTRDVFIPLDDRVGRAQQRGAALLISIHADALVDRGVRGASVYTLAQSASDPQTAALARTENAADRFAGPIRRNTSPEVAQILSSLLRQETRVGSARLARSLVRGLDRDLPMLPNPIRHAGFAVLKAADVPSVLVEMGFMSNPRDEAALRRHDHRHVVADAIRRSIDTYFAAPGPTPQRVAEQFSGPERPV